MIEEWRPVLGLEGLYEVSSEGRVRVLKPRYRTNPGGLLAQSARGRYLHVMLRRGARHCGHQVHDIVAAAFLGARPKGYAVNHKNGRKHDNRAANLEYLTPADNNRHAVATGLNQIQGEQHPNAKLRDHQVAEIRAKYRPRIVTMPSLASEYGVSLGTIEDILRGRRRKNARSAIAAGAA